MRFASLGVLCPLFLAFLKQAVCDLCGPLGEGIFDWNFESGRPLFDTWNTTSQGRAFQNVTFGDNPSARNDDPSHHQGDWWLSSFESYTGPGSITPPGTVLGLVPTGTIESFVFCIDFRSVSFLIAGSRNDNCKVSLIVNDPARGQFVEVFSFSGRDSTTMRRVTGNVDMRYYGFEAHIAIVDGGSDCFVAADDFSFTQGFSFERPGCFQNPPKWENEPSANFPWWDGVVLRPTHAPGTWNCATCSERPWVTKGGDVVGVATVSFNNWGHYTVSLDNNCSPLTRWCGIYNMAMRGQFPSANDQIDLFEASNNPGCVRLYPSAPWGTTVGHYQPGDLLSITVEHDCVIYRKNGLLMFKSHNKIEWGNGYKVRFSSWRAPDAIARPIFKSDIHRFCTDPKFLPTDWKFETGTLEGWLKTGDAFDSQPVFGDNSNARGEGASGLVGDWWIGTFEASDRQPTTHGEFQGEEPQGVLTSLDFCIAENRISFLVGGGRRAPNHATGPALVALFVDGDMVLWVTGENSEAMRRVEWDVSEYFGKHAQIQIIDGSSNGWGHINADDFWFYGQCPIKPCSGNGCIGGASCTVIDNSNECLSHSHGVDEVFGANDVRILNDPCVWYVDEEKCEARTPFKLMNANSDVSHLEASCKEGIITLESSYCYDHSFSTIKTFPAGLRLPVTSCDEVLCSSEPLVTSFIEGPAGFEFQMKDYLSEVYLGLNSQTCSPQPGTTNKIINFGLVLVPDAGGDIGNILVKEEEVDGGRISADPVGTYTTADKITILVESGQVVYRKNGNLLYRSRAAVELPLFFSFTEKNMAGGIVGLRSIEHDESTKFCLPPEESGVSWDFEAGSLKGWHELVPGTAFQYQPTFGDNPAARRRERSNLQGNWWIGGYERFQNDGTTTPGAVHGDPPVGGIVSNQFCITQNRISMLVGGGNHPTAAYVALEIDGEDVLKTTGLDSETMTPRFWDVDEYIGKMARIKIVDHHTGGWGHINVDLIRFQGQCPPLPDGVNCGTLTEREVCLSSSHGNRNSDPHYGSNCVWCVEGPCFSNSAQRCTTRTWHSMQANAINDYVVASCESAAYLGPLDVSPREFFLSEDDVYAQALIVSLAFAPKEDVECCLDFSTMIQDDGSMPIGSNRCCVVLSEEKGLEQQIRISAKASHLSQSFSGQLGVHCKSDDPEFCDMEKEIAVSGRPTPDGRVHKCTGWGDVHYNNFAGERFDFHGVGNLWYVKTSHGEFGVQTKTKPCLPWIRANRFVSCHEAVAISYRSELITVILPQDSLVVNLNQPVGNQYLKVTLNANMYTIKLPIGGEVRVVHNKVGNFAYFDVYVDSPPSYDGQITHDCACGCTPLGCPDENAQAWNRVDTEVIRVASQDDLFQHMPVWEHEDWEDVSGKQRMPHTCQDCAVALTNLKKRECENPCCDCRSNVLCAPEDCCGYECEAGDLCCEDPSSCCQDQENCCSDPNGCDKFCCDHFDPSCSEENYCCWDCVNKGMPPAHLPDMSCCCWDCRNDGDAPFGKTCCNACYECQAGQTVGPNGEKCCCDPQECCKDDCDWVFDRDFVKEAAEACPCVEREIISLREGCLLDGSILGCDFVKPNFGGTIECIIRNIIDGCDCPPPPICPLSCDLMGDHVDKIMTDTSCVCKCEDGFFGPQCDRTGTAACTNLDAENSLLSGGDIMYIEVQHVYTSDAVKCHFYAQSPATGRLITHATGAQVVASTEQCLALYGTAICEYSAIRCRTPPNDWVGYHLDATNWRAVYEIHLKISTDMRFNFGQTACMWNYAANCYTSFLGGRVCQDGYIINQANINASNPSHSVCCRKIICSDWIQSNDCNLGYEVDQRTLNSEEVGHDICCTMTPAPTNAPTWPPHLFVPKLVQETPWFESYTNGPTQPPVAFPTPAPQEINYVPAKPGTTILPYCLGFGTQCEPVYTNY